MEYPVRLQWSERAAAYIAEAVGFPGGCTAMGPTETAALAELGRVQRELEQKKVEPKKADPK